MNKSKFSSLSVKKETVKKVKAFIRFRSIADFVEEAVKEKIERERIGQSSKPACDGKGGGS